MDDAVAAGRGLLALDPADWQSTLAFKRDVRATGRYPDGEASFRHAASLLPDEAWLAHYGALHAFHGDDLPVLRQRVERMVAAAPSNAALHALAGSVAWQQRDYATAERHYAANPAQQAYRLGMARLYRRLSHPVVGGQAYGVAAINLDRNAERWALLQRETTSGPPLHRIAGVLGSPLPDAAARRLGAPGSGRGTLGCFLSHAAAWEWMLAQRLPHALVIEDDVQPTLDLPDTLAMPPGCELCFVNDQMEPRLPLADLQAAAGFRTVPLADVMRGFPADENAAGANGYVLSAAGAGKLLDWVEADGFEGDVDWRMIQYSLTPPDLASLDRSGEAYAALARLPALPRPDRLNAAVLHPALIRTIAITSDREDENRAGDRG